MDIQLYPVPRSTENSMVVVIFNSSGLIISSVEFPFPDPVSVVSVISNTSSAEAS